MSDQLSDELIEVLRLGRRAAFVRRHRRAVSALVLALSILTCGALALVAGWSATLRRLSDPQWFLGVTLVAHFVAYGGYVAAHHEVVNRSRVVPVGWARGALMVVIGFGAWLIGGGFAVDRRALQWTGFTRRDAGIAAVALGGLELALLTPAAWVCALLLLDSPVVADGATVPWVVGVPIGFALALAGAWRGARQPADAPPSLWGDLLAGLAAALGLLRDLRRGPLALAAIGVYWAADIAALWAALRFLSVSVSVPRLLVAYATGYLLTRRTLPFAGVIVTEALMAVALVWVGVPLAAAVPAVLVYRLSDFALTLGGALIASSAVERNYVLSRTVAAEPVAAEAVD